MPLGKKQPPPMSTKDQLRGQQKVLRGAQRQLTRDQQQLERQEKQLEAEIKKAAKQGNKQIHFDGSSKCGQCKGTYHAWSTHSVGDPNERSLHPLVDELTWKLSTSGYTLLLNILAKQLVQLRKQKTRSMVVNSKVTGIGHQLKVAQTTATMAGAIGTSTRAMATVNAAINPQQLQHTLQTFERETTKMDMAGELMDETLDDILAGSDEEEQSEQLISQVLDEIGLDTTSKLVPIPVRRQELETPTVDSTEDLEQRLSKLHS